MSYEFARKSISVGFPCGLIWRHLRPRTTFCAVTIVSGDIPLSMLLWRKNQTRCAKKKSAEDAIKMKSNSY